MKLCNAALVVLLSFSLLACQGKRPAKSDAASNLKRIHFDYDRASIRPDMVPIMDGNYRFLSKNQNQVVIEGHCDDRGTNEYNLALGDRRAQGAKSYLVNRGVASSRLRVVSYGEERPIAFGSDETSWFMNRRAEFAK